VRALVEAEGAAPVAADHVEFLLAPPLAQAA
jgi:hypothetical protein